MLFVPCYSVFMVKIVEDTIERLAEQGKTQAKKAAQTVVSQVKQTFSPTKMWEQILGTSSKTSETSNVTSAVGESAAGGGKTAEVGKGLNHTPLNFEKLGGKYKDIEAQKTEALRQRLFQLVKSGDEKVLQEKKQAIQEKKRQETYEAQEKKKQEEKKKQTQESEIPKGKVRRSIFSHKKVAERQHSEVKPATGKQ